MDVDVVVVVAIVIPLAPFFTYPILAVHSWVLWLYAVYVCVFFFSLVIVVFDFEFLALVFIFFLFFVCMHTTQTHHFSISC